jgi:hypothetical protein
LSADRTPMSILLPLGAAVVVGAPMVMVIWHNLSELLAGRSHTLGLLVSAGLLVLFLFLVRALARTLGRLRPGH